MRAAVLVTVILLSGALAGLVLSAVNLVIVAPYLDQAIGIENQNLFDSGRAQDTPQFWAEYDAYRMWQKSGSVYAGVILGMSIGSLFGIVYALSQRVLPGRNSIEKSLILAGVMWFTLYLVPFLKYPANPPATGDGETVALMGVIYLGFIAISGLGALGFYSLAKKLDKKFLALIGYAVFISVAFVAMPENPDKMAAPVSLVNEFRLMSVVSMSSLWVSMGLFLGLFWHRFVSPKKSGTYSYSESLE